VKEIVKRYLAADSIIMSPIVNELGRKNDGIFLCIMKKNKWKMKGK